MEITTIGLDLAKNVFQAHGATATGAVGFRKKLRREQVLAFFSAQPLALSRWRLAQAPTFGRGRLANSDTRCG
jgi:transposase